MSTSSEKSNLFSSIRGLVYLNLGALFATIISIIGIPTTTLLYPKKLLCLMAGIALINLVLTYLTHTSAKGLSIENDEKKYAEREAL